MTVFIIALIIVVLGIGAYSIIKGNSKPKITPPVVPPVSVEPTVAEHGQNAGR